MRCGYIPCIINCFYIQIHLFLGIGKKRVVYIDKFMDIGEMIQMIIKELKKSKKENCEEIQDENCNCNR